MAAIWVVQAFAVAPSALALGTTPDRTWNANGTVFATALSEDGSTLYIGGKFTRVRENPPGIPGPAPASPSAMWQPSMSRPAPPWTPEPRR
jgi:hypothetical protein